MESAKSKKLTVTAVRIIEGVLCARWTPEIVRDMLGADEVEVLTLLMREDVIASDKLWLVRDWTRGVWQAWLSGSFSDRISPLPIELQYRISMAVTDTDTDNVWDVMMTLCSTDADSREDDTEKEYSRKYADPILAQVIEIVKGWEE